MFGTKPHEGDPRVAKALDDLGIKYRVDADGDFQFIFGLQEDRSQSGFIRSRTSEFAGIEIREIVSPAMTSQGPFDARTANILLDQNSRVKLGAWATQHNAEGHHIAVFIVKIAADLEGEPLLAAIAATLATADDMEKSLVGNDQF